MAQGKTTGLPCVTHFRSTCPQKTVGPATWALHSQWAWLLFGITVRWKGVRDCWCSLRFSKAHWLQRCLANVGLLRQTRTTCATHQLQPTKQTLPGKTQFSVPRPCQQLEPPCFHNAACLPSLPGRILSIGGAISLFRCAPLVRDRPTPQQGHPHTLWHRLANAIPHC